jgi:GH15 family glucan-1,4-alpha-glucosidase
VTASCYAPIADYAIIGDCRSAALVSRSGSLDWLCLPRFDSPSIFSAILDDAKGGRFRIQPLGTFKSERRYLPGTPILETTFRTAGGAVVLRDSMSVESEGDKAKALYPDHEVLREIEGIEGEVELEIWYEPRPNYGAARASLRQRGALGIWSVSRNAALALLSDLPLDLVEGHHAARGTGHIHAGEIRHLSLTYADDDPAIIPPLGEAAGERLNRTRAWWEAWSRGCDYRGPYGENVLRSAITLKLMDYAPSGAVVAAPTTSLPEALGGVRNWDYRYCWLRDAAFTLRSLFNLGYHEEAHAFVSWILETTRLTWPELQVVYNIFGEPRLPEQVLRHLDGYADSRPVRVGNAARGQLQLDVYGEVVDAAVQFIEQGGEFDNDTRRMLSKLGEAVCEHWQDPDEGIWEERAGPRQHTHSKVLCWVALERLLALHDKGHLDVPYELFVDNRDRIRETVEAQGYNPDIASYVSILGGDKVDACLLTLPLYGYCDATSPRMRSTIDRIRKVLSQDGLVHRYPSSLGDGLPPGEAAFGICSFWAVECLALSGDIDEAKRAFEDICSHANDVGLFSEEIDPATGALLGNFPQAFTHVGLINAALTLARCSASGKKRGQSESMTRAEKESV